MIGGENTRASTSAVGVSYSAAPGPWIVSASCSSSVRYGSPQMWSMWKCVSSTSTSAAALQQPAGR